MVWGEPFGAGASHGMQKELGWREAHRDTEQTQKRRQENHPAIKHLVGFVLPGGAMCTK